MVVEMEYKDPNGEVQTVSSRIPLWRLKLPHRDQNPIPGSSKEAFKFHVALVISTGNRSGVLNKSGLFERKTYSHRKRLVGGVYAYEHTTETKRITTLCEGRTDPKGLLICEVTSPVSGNVILHSGRL